MHKTKIGLITVSAMAVIAFVILSLSFQQVKEPWTQQQLMQPVDLAKIINDPQAPQPLIYCIGFQEVIKNSIFMGPAKDKSNLKKFKEALEKLPKDANIVIYCGCCPFSRCPNIRPAFELLNEMGFKNQKLLNLTHNIKTDWIDKGYPVND